MISFIKKHIDSLSIECDFAYEQYCPHSEPLTLFFLSIADKNLFLITWQNSSTFKPHATNDKALVLTSVPFDFHNQQNINDFIGKF